MPRNPTDKTITFEITISVDDPVAMRAEALRRYLARGGDEADFAQNEQFEDKFSETPVSAWLDALFSNYEGPGFSFDQSSLTLKNYYQPPPLPEGFDPATSVSAAQIAKLMAVALDSDKWSDLKLVLPKRFKALVTNPAWYADPALYDAQQPWYFKFTKNEPVYDEATKTVEHKNVVHKIGRADIIAALANLAEDRPRRIIEIMNGNTDFDLADLFFQTVVFKEFCYYD